MSCQHEDIIFDSVTGDQICCQCALVVQNSIIMGIDLPYSHHESEPYILEQNLRKEYIMMLDFVKNACLPERYAELAFKKYQSIFGNLNISCLQSDVISARVHSCLYEILHENGSGYTLKEICAISGVSSQLLSQTHKRLFFSKGHQASTFLRPSMLIHRFSAKAGLSRRDACLVMKNLEVDEKTMCFMNTPALIACVYIYKYCTRSNKNVPLSILCEIAGVSQISVMRFLKNESLKYIS